MFFLALSDHLEDYQSFNSQGFYGELSLNICDISMVPNKNFMMDGFLSSLTLLYELSFLVTYLFVTIFVISVCTW